MDKIKAEIDKLYREIDGLCYKNGKKIFPVPLIKIAKGLGYEVYTFKPSFDGTSETSNISGIVDYDKNEILLNESDFVKRQRFTLAHEIGHIYLNHQKSGETVDYRKDMDTPETDPKEREANEFAAELLMPEDEFREKFGNNKDIAKLAEVARYFSTSYFATEIRAKELGLRVTK
jgi:Zn-dependent peptidase ImmA (M78 family)